MNAARRRTLRDLLLVLLFFVGMPLILSLIVKALT